MDKTPVYKFTFAYAQEHDEWAAPERNSNDCALCKEQQTGDHRY